MQKECGKVSIWEHQYRRFNFIRRLNSDCCPRQNVQEIKSMCRPQLISNRFSLPTDRYLNLSLLRLRRALALLRVVGGGAPD